MKKPKPSHSSFSRTLTTVLVALVFFAVSTAQTQASSAPETEIQNGQVLDRKVVSFPPGVAALARQRIASVAELLAEVELQRISYASDGLKVKGYLALPKRTKDGEKLPCIIFNRGGNSWPSLEPHGR